jgi:hypothetical protein
LQVVFKGAGGPASGPVEGVQYSARQYRWRPSATGGRPALSLPPEAIRAPDWRAITLPPLSLTVARG